MQSNFYNIGNIIINMLTPSGFASEEPYSLFECSPSEADFTAKFSFSDVTEPPNDEVFLENDFFDVRKHGDKLYFSYKRKGQNGYYAVRVQKEYAASVENPFCIAQKKPHINADIIVNSEYKNKLWQRVAFNLCGFEELLNGLGAFILHSSFIIYNGTAVLFTAPCGTGKSTQAELWKQSLNAEIINGDKAMLYCDNGVLYAAGLPFSGSSGICKNAVSPVKAIVRLTQGNSNCIYRLTGLNAFTSLYKGCYPPVTSTESFTLRVEQACNIVPVYHLSCLPDNAAVMLLKNTVYGG